MLGLGIDDAPEVLRFLGDVAQMPPEALDALDDVPFTEFLSGYRLPQALISYLGMQANVIFVVPIDLLATSEMIRVLQDFGRGGAGRYHRGGFGALAEAMCLGVERNGGGVLLDARVERIHVEGGRVTGVETPRGRFDAPIVVSNAGIQPTVLRLVGEEHFDPSYRSRVREFVPSWAIVGTRYFPEPPLFRAGHVRLVLGRELHGRRPLRAHAVGLAAGRALGLQRGAVVLRREPGARGQAVCPGRDLLHVRPGAALCRRALRAARRDRRGALAGPRAVHRVEGALRHAPGVGPDA